LIISEFYYFFKHLFQKDKGVCPKCKSKGFEHGFRPYHEFYCTKCDLWVPEHIKELEELVKKA